jgi:hypothetical protein
MTCRHAVPDVTGKALTAQSSAFLIDRAPYPTTHGLTRLSIAREPVVTDS